MHGQHDIKTYVQCFEVKLHHKTAAGVSCLNIVYNTECDLDFAQGFVSYVQTAVMNPKMMILQKEPFKDRFTPLNPVCNE